MSFAFVISDKKAACFALGGGLKALEFWTLLKCEMECCTESNCNTQTPTLTQAAITVFTPDGKTKHSTFRLLEDDYFWEIRESGILREFSI